MSQVGQLVYSKFPDLGLRVLASVQVPVAIRRAFVFQVVNNRWSMSQPPAVGYRAVYLLQLGPAQYLWGWLYSMAQDGGPVPYFLCYYRNKPLDDAARQILLAYLEKGPPTWVDTPPADPLPAVDLPELSKYTPVRPGLRLTLPGQAAPSLDLFTANQQPSDFLPVPTLAPLPSRWPWGLGAVGILLGVAMVGYNQWESTQPSERDRTLIQTARVLARAGDYEQCRSQAAAVAPDSALRAEASVLQGECTVNQPPLTLQGHRDTVWAVAIHEKKLVSGSADQLIKFWDLGTGTPRSPLLAHGDIVRALVLSLDGQTLVSGSGDQTIGVWEVSTGRLVRTLTGHTQPVWSLALGAEGTLVSGSGDRTIKVWKVSTGRLLKTLTGHTDRVYAVALSPDGQTLASGSEDRTIKIWDLATGQHRTLTGHREAVRALAFTPDGHLISGSWDKTLRVWDLATGVTRHTLIGHQDRVLSLAVQPDGTTLASGGRDNLIKLWDISTGSLLKTLTGHQDWVVAVAFSPDGKVLSSGSKDRTLRVWPATSWGPTP
ncbi:WD40 repeat domain-containing protein [Candidatus Cyanaurora vandensis]|uniref:WD40 repeat domain-containing protein n=1 Tax=Candidatus Cyanaurora vandensis TaxID=2714958 RepID=UPI00257A87EC|nr:WD40 repeat domain-containing protein [Candidatus Cyanaurora vandensis]